MELIAVGNLHKTYDAFVDATFSQPQKDQIVYFYIRDTGIYFKNGPSKEYLSMLEDEYREELRKYGAETVHVFAKSATKVYMRVAFYTVHEADYVLNEGRDVVLPGVHRHISYEETEDKGPNNIQGVRAVSRIHSLLTHILGPQYSLTIEKFIDDTDKLGYRTFHFAEAMRYKVLTFLLRFRYKELDVMRKVVIDTRPYKPKDENNGDVMSQLYKTAISRAFQTFMREFIFGVKGNTVYFGVKDSVYEKLGSAEEIRIDDLLLDESQDADAGDTSEEVEEPERVE